VNTRSGVGLI